MKIVLQRVKEASVTVDEKLIGKCNNGFLILLGIAKGDTQEDVLFLVQKTINLRVFADQNGKMNLSLANVEGEVLVISQFTLLANCQHGNRPDFFESESPKIAEDLYEFFISEMKKHIPHVEHGIFGADMQVSLINDGPVTIVLDSTELMKRR